MRAAALQTCQGDCRLRFAPVRANRSSTGRAAPLSPLGTTNVHRTFSRHHTKKTKTTPFSPSSRMPSHSVFGALPQGPVRKIFRQNGTSRAGRKTFRIFEIIHRIISKKATKTSGSSLRKSTLFCRTFYPKPRSVLDKKIANADDASRPLHIVFCCRTEIFTYSTKVKIYSEKRGDFAKMQIGNAVCGCRGKKKKGLHFRPFAREKTGCARRCVVVSFSYKNEHTFDKG